MDLIRTVQMPGGSARLRCVLLIGCCLLGLRAVMGSWEDEVRMVMADKGWFPSEEESNWGIESGPTRELQSMDRTNIKIIQASPGPPRLISDSIADGEYNVSSVLFDIDSAIWETEMNDPMKARRKRCRSSKGEWCGRFDRQSPLPFSTPPRGSVACPRGCNDVGNCNYDIGICDCPAGWAGDDCTTRQLRPCTNSRDRPKDDPFTVMSHIDSSGRDLNPLKNGWTASRCSGICDPETAQCWCDSKNRRYARIPAPEGSPPGTPPLNVGRPLGEFCSKIKQTANGEMTTWGNVDRKKIYGPTGWCEASRGERCDPTCPIDGMSGPYCEEITEAYCPNQCSGLGECKHGFCKCKDGWYGTDCSKRTVEPSEATSDGVNGAKPWLGASGFGRLPLAGLEGNETGAESERAVGRKRPLIYVYDMPPAYTTRMLQYRLTWKACVWRAFQLGNTATLVDWIYGIETYLHDAFLASSHRTLDPEEADFFYVPYYMTCYFWPVIGYADFPYWYQNQGGVRPNHGANMLTEMLNWIRTKYPFWNKTQGKDHIWLAAHDEGACWYPTEIYKNSIILTHWGRLGLNHSSGTAYIGDNYSQEEAFPPFQNETWTDQIKGHACYTPGKDLVIPSYKPPSHYSGSPLMGAEPKVRDLLLFFRGDVGTHRLSYYSRGIRQRIANLSETQDWTSKYNILIQENGYSIGKTGSYTDMLSRSVFCLVAPGDGWSARAEDAVLHGCIPLIIMDGVHGVFESILDWDMFSVRIKESSIPHIPEILMSISNTQIARMQRRLMQVWHRFAYMEGKLMRDNAESVLQKNKDKFPPERSRLPSAYPIQRVLKFPVQDDAFSTIMQWLYYKLGERQKQRTAEEGQP